MKENSGSLGRREGKQLCGKRPSFETKAASAAEMKAEKAALLGLSAAYCCREPLQ